MMRLALLIIMLSGYVISFGQKENSIGLSFIGRSDQQANYVSNFADRVYNDTNKLYGLSYGINAIFKRKISKSTFVYYGLGYYQLRIDKIRATTPFNIPGGSIARNIVYPSSFFLLYSTSKYHYNDVAITVGFDKIFLFAKTFSFDISPEIIGYKTVSQKYKIGYSPDYYVTHNSKPLEFGINVKTGVIKEFTHFYLQPSLLIPVYQNLKGDRVFYEDRNMDISKWFHGIGVSFTVGKNIYNYKKQVTRIDYQ